MDDAVFVSLCASHRYLLLILRLVHYTHRLSIYYIAWSLRQLHQILDFLLSSQRIIRECVSSQGK